MKSYLRNTETHGGKFFYEGKNNNSPLLTWFIQAYGHKAMDIQLDDFIAFYLEVFDTCIEIVHCKIDFANSCIVGYISTKSVYIGKYYYDANNEHSNPQVKGETVDTVETIEILRDYLVKELEDKYKL